MEKILIIDDEPDVAELMKLVLENEGYHVGHFLDPRKGLAAVRDFDLLVLDMLMLACQALRYFQSSGGKGGHPCAHRERAGS